MSKKISQIELRTTQGNKTTSEVIPMNPDIQRFLASLDNSALTQGQKNAATHQVVKDMFPSALIELKLQFTKFVRSMLQSAGTLISSLGTFSPTFSNAEARCLSQNPQDTSADAPTIKSWGMNT